MFSGLHALSFGVLMGWVGKRADSVGRHSPKKSGVRLSNTRIRSTYELSRSAAGHSAIQAGLAIYEIASSSARPNRPYETGVHYAGPCETTRLDTPRLHAPPRRRTVRRISRSRSTQHAQR